MFIGTETLVTQLVKPSHETPKVARIRPVNHPSPTMRAHPARTSAWGRHYNIQAVAFDLLIAFSLIFPRTHGFRSTTIPAVIK